MDRNSNEISKSHVVNGTLLEAKFALLIVREASACDSLDSIAYNAPVTRAFVIACALFTVFFGIQGRSNRLGLSYMDIFGKFRIWKLVVSVFAFSSTPELMFGLYLLYYFRVFERQIGSNKYSVFILFSMTFSLLLVVIALALLKDITDMNPAKKTNETRIKKVSKINLKSGLGGNLDPLLIWKQEPWYIEDATINDGRID
ncbi:hypothetical protein L484_014699 [Morus notabilis]|uniref:Uncharacterized protein n=1 Tax=Morus notabilis TaxID=981085 RepID=W9SC52_9ROSA|nr:hypothetical protein L484_014699 [Morus notabilis]